MDDEVFKSLIRFLVVDNSILSRTIIKRSLRHAGFTGTVLEAQDGVEALSIFYEKEIDCIILDLYMPKMNGFELALKVRQGAGSELLAILMITSEHTLAKLEEALDSGIDDYITKPYTEDVFVRKMTKLMPKIQRKKLGSDNKGQSQPTFKPPKP